MQARDEIKDAWEGPLEDCVPTDKRMRVQQGLSGGERIVNLGHIFLTQEETVQIPL